MPKARYDSGRMKIYDAERTARKILRKNLQNFDTLEACQSFVNDIVASPVWHELGGPEEVLVKSMPRIGRRGLFVRRRALGLAKYKKDKITGDINFSHISLAPREFLRGNRQGWDNFTILHELAHAANPYEEKHAKRFIQAHLKLLRHVLGTQAERVFQTAYIKTNLL